LNRINVKGGWLLHLPRSISHHILCKSTSSPMISPMLVLLPRLFCWPVNQINSSGVNGGKRHAFWERLDLNYPWLWGRIGRIKN
jgi:hypothetical protein